MSVNDSRRPGSLPINRYLLEVDVPEIPLPRRPIMSVDYLLKDNAKTGLDHSRKEKVRPYVIDAHLERFDTMWKAYELRISAERAAAVKARDAGGFYE